MRLLLWLGEKVPHVNPLLGATFLFGGSPRIKKRQDRGAQRAGWVDLRCYTTSKCHDIISTPSVRK